jgi:NitT/TauT family transport system permease protein
MSRKTLEKLAPVGLLVATLLVWQAACSVFEVSEFVFPAPRRSCARWSNSPR